MIITMTNQQINIQGHRNSQIQQGENKKLLLQWAEPITLNSPASPQKRVNAL